MKYIQGCNRKQLVLFPTSLDDIIEQENDVRFIDLFVESLDIRGMGFKVDHIENGRPAYHPQDLLKLYIYGYLNSIRSSRKLEKATKINTEVMWLLKGLEPDHNTISNFRRDNPRSIKKVFRVTVEIAKNFELIGGKLIAGDSTKLRAQNSKKHNFNKKKIERHLAYIENRLEEYNQKMQIADNDKDNTDEQREENIEQIKKEIEKQNNRKEEYKNLTKQLDETGQTQISTSDPQSRQIVIRNQITEVAYNIQTTVDAKNNIPIDFKTTNTNDSKAMGTMLRRAKAILKSNEFTALYDKGYHTGSEFDIAHKLGINVLVAVPRVATQAPNPLYNTANFAYDKIKDIYICPEGNVLRSNGNQYKCATHRFKRYSTRACKSCQVKEECSKAGYGRFVQRSEYKELIENNRQRVEKNKDYYRRRQAIVEHPYGTIKRQWGFSYIMTKKYIKRAQADMGVIFTVYNLRRLMNIIGTDVLKEYLRSCIHLCINQIENMRLKISQFKLIYVLNNLQNLKQKQSLKIAYI